MTVALYSTAGSDWNGAAAELGSEAELTFNKRPADGVQLAQANAASSPGWMEFSGDALKEYIDARLGSEDKLVTFKLQVTSTGLADINSFRDREGNPSTCTIDVQSAGKTQTDALGEPELGLVGLGGPLSVNLSYIHGQRDNNDTAHFTWETATETGNAGFNLYMDDGDELTLITPEMIPRRSLTRSHRHVTHSGQICPAIGS